MTKSLTFTGILSAACLFPPGTEYVLVKRT